MELGVRVEIDSGVIAAVGGVVTQLDPEAPVEVAIDNEHLLDWEARRTARRLLVAEFARRKAA